MRDVLFLASRLPYPPDRRETLRAFHMLKYLSARYRVHLACFVDDAEQRKQIGKVKSYCYETCFIERHRLWTRAASLRGLLSGEALSLSYYRDARMRDWIAYLMRTRAIGAAIACSAPMAQYLERTPSLRRLVDLGDVESRRWRRAAEAAAWPLGPIYRREAECLLRYERATLDRFDHATLASTTDAGLFSKAASQGESRISTLSNGVDADHFSPHILYRNPYPGDCTAIVHAGATDDRAGAEAACWFAREVFPSLLARRPGLRLYLLPQRQSLAVAALARLPGVVVRTGMADVRPFLAHAALAVAPLRRAAAVQGQVLEAMSMQKTVVASSHALAGLSACPDSEVLLANDAEQYIGQIGRVLDGATDRRIGMAARARVLQDYCWEAKLCLLGNWLAPACAPVACHG